MVVYGCYSWSKGIKRRRNEHWVISTLSCKPIDYVPCLLTFHTFLFFCFFLEAILCCCLVLFVMFVLTILTEMKWEAEQIHHKTCVLRKHPRFGQLCYTFQIINREYPARCCEGVDVCRHPPLSPLRPALTALTAGWMELLHQMLPWLCLDTPSVDTPETRI